MVDKVIELIELSEDELFGILGLEFIEENESNILPDKRIKAYAKTWYHRNKILIQDKICQNPQIIKLISFEKGELKVELFAAIIDLIVSMKIGVSPATLSAIILKQGLNNFCIKYWK